MTVPENQLTPHAAEETALAFVNAHGQVVGLENYDGSEFRLPRLILVQTATQQEELKAPIGSFYNTVTQTHSKELDATILAVNPNRWFGPDYDTSKAMKARNEKVNPWCQSSNGKTPDVQAIAALGYGVQHTSCKACPRAKFTKGGDGRNMAPQCTEMRKALIALADGSLALLVARKEACKEFDAFVQPFFLMKKPMFSVKVKLTTRSEKNGRGELYYIPVVRAQHDTPNTIEEQRRLYESIGIYTQFLAVGAMEDEAEETHVETPPVAEEAPVYTPPTPQAAPPTTAAPATAGPPPVQQPTIDVTAETVPQPVAPVAPVAPPPEPAPVIPLAAVPEPVAPAPVAPEPIAVAPAAPTPPLPPAAGPPPLPAAPVPGVIPTDPVPTGAAPTANLGADPECPF